MTYRLKNLERNIYSPCFLSSLPLNLKGKTREKHLFLVKYLSLLVQEKFVEMFNYEEISHHFGLNREKLILLGTGVYIIQNTMYGLRERNRKIKIQKKSEKGKGNRKKRDKKAIKLILKIVMLVEWLRHLNTASYLFSILIYRVSIIQHSYLLKLILRKLFK